MRNPRTMSKDGAAPLGRLWLLGALLAAAVVALTAPGVAHGGSNIVVAPKSGQELNRSPVKVSVRAPWKVRNLRVWLNGERVSREFRRAEIGKRHERTVRLSASHGLRYGSNVVRVTKRRFARKRRSDRVRFTLTRDRPLVGAGRDRRVEVGRSIRLEGHASRRRDAPRRGGAHKAKPPGSAAGLTMRWRLVRKPRGSKAKLPGRARGIQPPTEKVGKQQRPVPQPVRPRLKNLDKPGRYVASLVVVDRGVRSVADKVATTVVVGTPLVPFDSAVAVQGQRGIAIGYHPDEQGGRAPNGPDERFFPLGQGDLLQLVVLDRESLETIDSWSGPASDQSIAKLTAELGQYEDNRLAIVTAWCNADCDQYWGFAAHEPTQALVNNGGQGVSQIGASRLSPAQIQDFGLENGGQLTWIGVPGFSPGQAWEVGGVPDTGTGATSLEGFLSPDSNENYAYMAADPTTYDLGPDGQSVSMTVGPNEFSGSLPDGEGGFLVAYMTATTLSPADFVWTPSNGSAVYVTRNADGSPNYDGIGRMDDDLSAAATFGLPIAVAIRSIGPAPLPRMGLQPPDYQGSFDQEYANALDTLADLVSDVGGTRQLIWGMATAPTGADSYSLVGANQSAIRGVPPDLEASGADLGSQLSPQGQTRLAGILARDKQSRYVPKMAANQDVGGSLAELAVAEPTEWPNSSTPGERAALACIGNAQGLGPDPRIAYWLQTYTDAKWGEIQGAIQSMQPSACPDVDATDFIAVRDELVTEIGWLINVTSYTEALTTPFTNSGLTSFADLQSITQEVLGELSAAQGKNVGIDGLSIFADVLDILSGFDVPGAGAISGTFLLVSDLTASSDDGPTIDWGQRVEAGSASIGEELAGQLTSIADGNERLADIIVADYAKLSTVGRLGQCTPGDSGCTPEWQFTQPQQNAASRMYEITAKRQIWGGILPAGYPFVLYISTDPASFTGINSGPEGQISGIHCGQSLPFEGVTTPTFLRYGIRQPINSEDSNTGEASSFMLFSQQNFIAVPKKGSKPYPSPGLIDPLFAPLDPGGDPDKGGLGLDQNKFMIDNWQPPDIAGGGPTRVAWMGCV